MLMNSNEYLDLVQNIKREIQHAQYKAALSVNKELIGLYYNIGQLINAHKTFFARLPTEMFPVNSSNRRIMQMQLQKPRSYYYYQSSNNSVQEKAGPQQ